VKWEFCKRSMTGRLGQLLARPAVLLINSSGLHCSTALTARRFKYFPERDLKPPEKFENVQQPPQRHRLPIMPKTPSLYTTGSMRPPKGTKELWRMMGEEKIHNELQLNQFAIVALTGGMVKHKHFEIMRMKIGRFLKPEKSFAIYRIDAPYKPITDHGFGKRMGGGKGAIDEYGTPVRAGRVIVEVGGKVLWEECRWWLQSVAKTLPFPAMALSAEMMRRMNEEEQRLIATNKNPISFEWLVRNNMLDCQRKISSYDQRWFGKFVYKDRELNKKWQLVLRSKYPGGN